MKSSFLKYCNFSILFIFFSNFSFSQSVYFDPPLFDFNIIHENTGIVYHEFILKNNSLQNFKIKGIVNSCGCTSTEISNDSLYHHNSVKVRVGYNPANRPGVFFKQVTLVLEGLILDSLVVETYIKGIVLSKNEVAYKPINFDSSIINVKPITLTSTTKDVSEVFNDFVNDLTIIIDKDGFANVNLEYFQAKLTEEERKKKALEIKQKVCSALILRGYQSFQIGFVENEIKKMYNTFPNTFFAVLKVVGYNKGNIHESRIIHKGLENFTVQPLIYDSIAIRYSLQVQNPQESIHWKAKKESEFITQIVRMVLMKGSAEIGIYVNGLFSSGEESFIKKTLNPQIENLAKELANQGINFEKISILPPVFKKGEVYNMSYNIIEYGKIENFVEWKKFQNLLDSIRRINEQNSNLLGAYKNNIPVYYQRVENQDEFDTTHFHFKEWFNLLKSAYSTNKKLKIIIEATSSNVPTTKEYDNAFVARRRGSTTISRLKEFAKRNGIANAANLFTTPYALVKGPLFNENDFSIKEYKKYQYIKLIVVEEDKEIIYNSKPVPFQFNFMNEGFDLPTTGKAFQNFVDLLIPSIQKFGYVEVALESSASRIPNKNYNRNEILAFDRLQKTKSEILKSMAQKGYNPLRIIFVEERILVQGPEFKEGESNDSKFKEFQYIKIIPKSN